MTALLIVLLTSNTFREANRKMQEKKQPLEPYFTRWNFKIPLVTLISQNMRQTQKKLTALNIYTDQTSDSDLIIDLTFDNYFFKRARFVF